MFKLDGLLLAQAQLAASIADLAPVASTFILGGPSEWETRPTGVPGLKEKYGLTYLVVAHDLNPLLSALDGAIYLLDGHPHYAGVDDVVSEELLTHLYGTAIKVVRTAQGDLFTRSA